MRRHAVDGGKQRRDEADAEQRRAVAQRYADDCALAGRLLAAQIRDGNPTAAHLAALLLGQDRLGQHAA